MEIKGKVHCLFEQSGTFKREFIKLGIPAEDYDLQNNFGETNHVVDLFAEIRKGYEGKEKSIFDDMSPDDLIMSFFPCIRFCNIAEYNQRSAQEKWRRDGVPVKKIWENLKKAADERHEFYILCLEMHAAVETRGLRMIMENPWSTCNYTNYFWFMKPAIIDQNRRERGDYFAKPTAFWFLNCEPTRMATRQPTPREQWRWTGVRDGADANHPRERTAKGSKIPGLCSEERSMISPDYARNFICDCVLGLPRPNQRLSLLDGLRTPSLLDEIETKEQ
ncbi:MAG: hypothetical protein J6Y62_01080 [Clostridia bacterium]|nr:hypothetical protein [Clostridia bacterium]